MSHLQQNSPAELERLRRWRLILGGGGADGIGISLEGRDRGMDNVLDALYAGEATGDTPGGRRGSGAAHAAPRGAEWISRGEPGTG